MTTPLPIPSPTRDLWRDMLSIVVLSSLQFVWLAQRIDLKVALINLLPSVVMFSAWTLFIGRYHGQRRRYLLPVLLLGLRLPWTVSVHFEALNWLLWLCIVLLTMRPMVSQFASGRKWAPLLTIAVVLANSLTHLGLDSPYTYTFRMINGLPSAYTGVDNNTTWECGYENPDYVVHCDARHFIASELIFSEPRYDPAFSVVLRRFEFGFLNSLIGIEGHRWWASLAINVWFWLLACVCIHRTCLLTGCDRRIAELSMLCCASVWSFVDMVAQPEPYLMAFAYAPIVVWATLELIEDATDPRKTALLLIAITSVVMVYDAYQLILLSMILLGLRGKYGLAAAVFLGQLGLALFWRMVSMRLVMGTDGNVASPSSGVSNLHLDVSTWWNAVSIFNHDELVRFGLRGVQAYLYGNLVIPAIAAWVFVCRGWLKRQQMGLVTLLFWLNLCVLLSSVFVAPQMTFWSPGTGMQPRLAAYSLPFDLVALVLLFEPLGKRLVWWVPAALFIVANIDTSGLASVALFFDYGAVQWVWK